MKKNVPTFQRCLFIITPLCNLRCKMCRMWREKNQYLSATDILNTLQNLKKLKVKDLVLSGGEPLLAFSILQKILITNSSRFNIYIISNGTLLEQKNLLSLLKVGARNFIISRFTLGYSE